MRPSRVRSSFLLLLCSLAAFPALAEDPKSLPDMVKGMQKIPGLITFYRMRSGTGSHGAASWTSPWSPGRRAATG